jgi:histidinol-phosphate aminotransferase
MLKYLRREIRDLEAYEVKERDYVVKLDANEGVDWLDGLNRYPVDRSDALRDKLARQLGKTPGELVFGNGSSELIELVFKAYLEAGETVVSFSPTFSMYRIFTLIHKGRYLEMPLKDMVSLDVEAFIAFANENRAKVVLISNPNNPTGTILSPEAIEKIVREVDAMVVIDEAYIEFSDQPLTDKTRDYPNAVVLRTFSKAYGLAGIRLGYMIAHEEVIGYINRVRSPYNLNVLTQGVGLKALESVAIARENIQMIKEERERMAKVLRDKGFDPLPSQANFLFFQAKKGLYRYLADQGVLIRGFGGDLEGYYRLTIGTPKENDIVINAIEEAQNERSQDR